MARSTNKRLPRHLKSFRADVVDNSTASPEYFYVTEFPETLWLGVNTIKFIPNKFALQDLSEIQVEAEDVALQVLNTSIEPFTDNGGRTTLNIEISDESPVGVGILTFVGNIKSSAKFPRGRTVKWQKTIFVNPITDPTGKVKPPTTADPTVTSTISTGTIGQAGSAGAAGSAGVAGSSGSSGTSGGGAGNPAGNDGEIQYNDAGAFGANPNLFWDKVNKTLKITALTGQVNQLTQWISSSGATMSFIDSTGSLNLGNGINSARLNVNANHLESILGGLESAHRLVNLQANGGFTYSIFGHRDNTAIGLIIKTPSSSFFVDVGNRLLDTFAVGSDDPNSGNNTWFTFGRTAAQGGNVRFDALNSGGANTKFVINSQFGGAPVGFGKTDPTAYVHIRAGTTSIPQIRLEPGVLTTTSLSGAIENDGKNVWYTPTNGAPREVLNDTRFVRTLTFMGA